MKDIELLERPLRSTIEERREIINGKKIMSPSPLFNHQYLARKIFRLMDAEAESSGFGIAMFAPMDVRFTDDNVFQPDLYVLSHVKVNEVKDFIQIIPDIIVEVISPSSYKHDTMAKRKIYEQYGVQEYWMVFPANRSIEVLKLENGTYALHAIAAEGMGMVTSTVLEGLEVPLAEVFDR